MLSDFEVLLARPEERLILEVARRVFVDRPRRVADLDRPARPRFDALPSSSSPPSSALSVAQADAVDAERRRDVFSSPVDAGSESAAVAPSSGAIVGVAEAARRRKPWLLEDDGPVSAFVLPKINSE